MIKARFSKLNPWLSCKELVEQDNLPLFSRDKGLSIAIVSNSGKVEDSRSVV